MYLHPSLLIFVPIFLLEGLLLPFFPVLGVTPMITILALALTFQFMSDYRIILICSVIGILGEFLFGVDKMGYLIGYVLLAGVLVLAKRVLRQPPYSGVAQLSVALLGLLVFELAVLLISPTIDIISFADFLLAVLMVQILMFGIVNVIESSIRRVA